MASILILQGANLGRLGTREPHIYGAERLEDRLAEWHAAYPGHRFAIAQSDVEGELIRMLQAAEGVHQGVVLNAGGYTHTSVALRDAVASLGIPVVEVHISNLLAREPFRHTSLIGGVCVGSIMGFGLDGYRLAVDHLIRRGE